MASPMSLRHCSTNPSLGVVCRLHGHSKLGHAAPGLPEQLLIGRRQATAAAAAVAVALHAKEAISGSSVASALEFRFTAPEQTPEEADAVVKIHARDLVRIKALIDSQSWREAQIALRESSSYLKQDLYTIIQAKPGSQRPQLRKLYSHLFNDVSSLDYAARDKDARRVQECYDNIVATLNEIFVLI
ncbi:psbQ-like protein 3, chloroplastic [Musa acuminata AAA Group]|uniref:psbQ-like protein 3, chloroplastic n=1 Tax=Musa acuminata AAA Group TaxID=214697 RepID=UPI0031DEA84C